MAIAGWMYFTHQTEWKAYLQDLVSQNDKALLRSIVLIDNLQTETERQTGESVEDNNVGWTKQDAKEMGSIAEKVRKGGRLTEGELAKSRNKMKKYWKQLMEISKRQQAEKGADSEHNQVESDHIFVEDSSGQYSINLGRRTCCDEGKNCEYGICGECMASNGVQIRINLSNGYQE